MSNKIEWLSKVEKYIIENGGVDLYYLLETMYNEEKMNFL